MKQATTYTGTKTFADTIKDATQWDFWKNKVSFSQDMITEIGMYLGIGFLLGFFIKKYSRIIVVICLIAIGLLALQHANFITITVNWNLLHKTMGIDPIVYNHDTVFASYWQWVTENMRIVLSFLGGLLIGFKLG